MLKKINIPFCRESNSINTSDVLSANYKDFRPTKEQLELTEITELVNQSHSEDLFREHYIPNFIKHIQRTTSQDIILENGQINPDFESETLMDIDKSTDHSHFIFLKSINLEEGKKTLRISIQDDETLIFVLADKQDFIDDKDQFMLVNNEYRSIQFDYYPPSIESKITQNPSKKISFFNPKPTKPVKELEFRNWHGNSIVIENLMNTQSMPDITSILTRFFSDRFLADMQKKSKIDLGQNQRPYIVQYRQVMKVLRTDSIKS